MLQRRLGAGATVGPLWALALTQFLVGAAQILALTAIVPLMTGVTSSRDRAAVFGLNTSAAMMVELLGSAAGGLLPALGRRCWRLVRRRWPRTGWR